MVRNFLILAIMSILSGCSSFLATAQSDPFRIGYVNENGKSIFGSNGPMTLGVITLDATRRAVVVSKTGKFCAEGPPPVAVGVSITSKADLDAEPSANLAKIKAGIDESFTSKINQLSDQTLLKIYITGNHALCQFDLNGVFKDKPDLLIKEFNNLTNKVLEAYKKPTPKTPPKIKTSPKTPITPAPTTTAPPT